MQKPIGIGMGNVRLSYELPDDLWFIGLPPAGDLPQAAEWDGSYVRGPFWSRGKV